MGFQHRGEAERCLRDLRRRLEKFGLTLHPEKTRLIEFGRFATERRENRGQGKPDTFDFLGFTHQCGKTRKGWFTIKRQSSGKRMRNKLREIKGQLRSRMHHSVSDVGRWLGSAVRGWMNYHAVPGNFRSVRQFRAQVTRIWLRVLRRRSQKARSRWTWERMNRLARCWLPQARILHPYPNRRLIVNYPR